MLIDPIVGDELTHQLTNLVNKLQIIVDGWCRGPLIIGHEVSESIENAIANVPTNNQYESIIIDMFREAIYNAERDAGGSSINTLRLLLGITRWQLQLKITCGSNIALSQLHDSMQVIIDIVSETSRRASQTDISCLIDQSFENDSIGDMIKHALTLVGADGKIFFELGRGILPQLELRTGYNFDLVKPIMTVSNRSILELYNVKIAIIDGFIESVAEIDHLLHAAHAAKTPLLLCARQFSPDVLSTISYNFRRGTLTVVPIVVPFDADSVNILKDLATIAGGDVTTALLGQLINNIDYNALPMLNHVTISSDRLLINHDTTKKSVDVTILWLRDQLQDPARQASVAFNAKRLRALSSRSVHIIMPENNLLQAHNVDALLQRVRVGLRHGVNTTFDVNAKLATAEIPDVLRKLIHDVLLTSTIQPTRSIVSMLHHVTSQVRLITSSGAIIAS